MYRYIMLSKIYCYGTEQWICLFVGKKIKNKTKHTFISLYMHKISLEG